MPRFGKFRTTPFKSCDLKDCSRKLTIQRGEGSIEHIEWGPVEEGVPVKWGVLDGGISSGPIWDEDDKCGNWNSKNRCYANSDDDSACEHFVRVIIVKSANKFHLGNKSKPIQKHRRSSRKARPTKAKPAKEPHLKCGTSLDGHHDTPTAEAKDVLPDETNAHSVMLPEGSKDIIYTRAPYKALLAVSEVVPENIPEKATFKKKIADFHCDAPENLNAWARAQNLLGECFGKYAHTEWAAETRRIWNNK